MESGNPESPDDQSASDAGHAYASGPLALGVRAQPKTVAGGADVYGHADGDDIGNGRGNRTVAGSRHCQPWAVSAVGLDPGPSGPDGRAEARRAQSGAALLEVPMVASLALLVEDQTEEVYLMSEITLYNADCREVMQTIEGESVQAIITDPPYEIGFIGKSWDRSGVAFDTEVWKECFRVLKPGGHLLAFGGTRTYHRMAVAIEDAGFEIRDTIEWIYNDGFTKGANVELTLARMGGKKLSESSREIRIGTTLKPAHEPIVMARKPLSEKTVAKNYLRHGSGALNIGECRIPREPWHWTKGCVRKAGAIFEGTNLTINPPSEDGRYPANVLCEDDTLAASGYDTRNFSLRVWEEKHGLIFHGRAGVKERRFSSGRNSHPTVKPIGVISWLVRLVSREGDTVLDPFMGSGTTGVACKMFNRHFVGIDREEEYVRIAEGRIADVDDAPAKRDYCVGV